MSRESEHRADTLAAQRRQLTVMFCDLAGSTELSSRLDPEVMHEIIAAYHRCCTEHIEQTGGFVAKYLGDGVLAYFGYPRAHEDDAERAVHAALLIRDAVPRLPVTHGTQLSVRIGIATGLVVVGELIGEGWAQERTVVGETPNLAARLQTFAQPNQVVISSMTQRLVSGLFEWRDLGRPDLKGLHVPDSIWEVVRRNTRAERFDPPRALAQGEMFGRDTELKRIVDSWRACSKGKGQIVGIVGDPGIGKSRLLYEVRKNIAVAPQRWVEGGSAQILRNTPFYTLSQMLMHIVAGDDRLLPGEYVDRLELMLRTAEIDGDEVLPLVAELIGAPAPSGRAPLTIGADERRRRLIAALSGWLLRIAEQSPTVFAIEDIHWTDPSTIEVLGQLAKHVSSVPLLLIYTARTGFTAPWPPDENHTQITLPRLASDDLTRLVQAAWGKPLTSDVLDNVLARSDGVPLFAHELARLMAASDLAAGSHEIPATLSDLLMARLDQLGPAKAVAQIVSVLGRDVSERLVGAVADIPYGEIQSALERLVAADILVRSTGGGEELFSFRHPLLEDAAYDALLKKRRRETHHRAAMAIEYQFSDLAERQPELLAQHWERAGEAERAVSAWQRAGRAANARRALKEAESHYESAIAIIDTLKPSPERDAHEFALQSSLAGILQITRGYAAERTVAVSARARELALAGGKLSHQLRQAMTEWAALSSAGQYRAGATLADQILRLAGSEGSPASLAQAYMVQMTSRYRLGDLIDAEDSFAMGSRYFEHPDFRRRPGVVAQTFGNAALIAWFLGDAAKARGRMELAIAISEEIGHPYDRTFARSMSSVLALLASDFAGAERAARESMAFCKEHGFPQIEPISRVVLGRALAGMGNLDDGIALIREGLDQMAKTSSLVAMTEYLTWLAEVQALDNALDEAIASVDHALRINPEEMFFRPESLRLRGELHLKKGDIDKARVDILDALALSSRMGSKLFHENAAASLARVNTWRQT